LKDLRGLKNDEKDGKYADDFNFFTYLEEAEF